MSSGTSTPRGDRSPPPPDGGGQPPAAGTGPAPLTIGKRFVKQYYQSLMTAPDNLPKLYRPTSVLSDGDGSTPADAVSFESAFGSADKLKDRFMVKDLQIRFEFEHGAIDAQQSVNGGILLVVTGHVVYYPSVTEDEDSAVDDPIRKGFVHTFFLGAHTIGTRVSYYVHNDILRFLKNTSEVSAGVAESTVTEPQPTPAAPAPAPKEVTPAPAEPVPETTTPAPETQQPPPEPVSDPVEPPKKEEKPIAPPAPVEETKDDAPGGGVEESKEEAPPVPAPAPAPKPPKEDKPNKKGNKGSGAKKEQATTEKDSAQSSKGSKSSPRTGKPQATKDLSSDAGRKSPVPPPSPAPKPPPGSWASLVAGAGGSTPASSGSAAKPPPPASTKPPPKPTPASEKPATQPSNDKKDQSSGGPTQNSGNQNNNSNSNNRDNRDNSNNHKMGNNMRPPKRDPDCTLVIKNLAEQTKENDVLALFEPFAAACKARVVGITVAAHRGIAFVDYDSINPVMKAVSKHQEEPMQLLGRVLEVDQKTAEQLARKQRAANQRGGGGGSYRSGSPSHNNGGINRYDSRGRGGHRRRDGGRGDRGGGGMGRGGGMGGRGDRGGR